MPWLRSFFVFPVLLLMALKCGSGDSKNEAEPPKSTARPPKQVHFFLETSASMGGYLKGYTEFKNVVTNLIAVLGKDTVPDSIWTVSENPVKYNDSPQNFGRTLATTPLASGRSSQLHKIFEKVATKAGNSNVSILVSDCILSFSDAEIKKDREINRDNASSTLKSDIKQTFEKLKKKNIGATLYAFQSAFNGDYYDYHNTKHKNVTEKQRPFYIWVIGHRDVIGNINKLLQADAGFKPMQLIDFGGGIYEVNSFKFSPSYGRKGEWQINEKESKIQKIKLRKPVEFAIGVNLSSTPYYLLDSLKNQLLVTSEQSTIKLLKVENVQDIRDKIFKEKDKKFINDNTHILTFGLTDMRGNDEATVNVALPHHFDNWYLNWSIDDDLDANQRIKKTFAFRHLVEGAKEAYDSDNRNYLSIKIKLSKD